MLTGLSLLTAQLCLLQDHDIYHKRLTGEGVPIDEGTKAKMIGPETNLDLMHTEGDATNTTVKCGSCYGAQARDEDCCNNCEEVGPAAAASACGGAQLCEAGWCYLAYARDWAFCCAYHWVLRSQRPLPPCSVPASPRAAGWPVASA